MSRNNGFSLRLTKEVSEPRRLEVLEEYLVVKDEQVRGAIASLSQISYVKKWNELDVESTEEEREPSQPRSSLD